MGRLGGCGRGCTKLGAALLEVAPNLTADGYHNQALSFVLAPAPPPPPPQPTPPPQVVVMPFTLMMLIVAGIIVGILAACGVIR